MNKLRLFEKLLVFALASWAGVSGWGAPLPTSFSYQGRLEDHGSPANGHYDLSFNLCTDLVVGTTNGSYTTFNVVVTMGTFTALVDFGVTVFDGTAYWLELAVRTNGSTGAFTTLSPRQILSASPYAFYALSAGSGRPGNTVNGNQATVGGGIQNDSSGDYATVGGGNQNRSANSSATVAGGDGNRIELNGDWGAIVGGHQNKVLGQYAFIGGGDRNCASGPYAIIGGGIVNTNQGPSGTISGGKANLVSADFGTVSGGASNRVSGFAATVVGGVYNEATGNFSLAGGRRAKAANAGSFVWGDSSDSDFASTAKDQFLIRAASGVGIGTTTPSQALTVQSATGEHSIQWQNSSFTLGVLGIGGDNNSGLISLGSGGVNNIILRANGSSSFIGGDVGIGTSNPGYPLDVNGTMNCAFAQITAGNPTLQFYSPGQEIFQLKQEGSSQGGASKFSVIENCCGNPRYLMTITYGGAVGIGTTSPRYGLEVNGSAGKPGGGTWADSSDQRLKKNIQPLRNALGRLMQLRGVSFEWINPEDHANQTNLQGGFLAQEVEAVFPLWVKVVPGGEYDKGLTPDGNVNSLSLPFEFDALLVEALRELRAEKDRDIAQLRKKITSIDDLKSLLMEKEAEIEALRERIAAQQEINAGWERRFAGLERIISRMAGSEPLRFAIGQQAKENR